MVATLRSKGNHDCRDTPLSRAPEPTPQSIEEILQLKGVDVERPQPPLNVIEDLFKYFIALLLHLFSKQV